MIDIVPFYPPSYVPSISVSLREYYITTYQDRFFTDPPNWFLLYLAAELFYHLPVSLWMIYGLLQDHPMVGLNLLVFGVETMVTTGTCLVEMVSWKSRFGWSEEMVWRLGGLYGGYLLAAVVMVVDGWGRVRGRVMMGKEKVG